MNHGPGCPAWHNEIEGSQARLLWLETQVAALMPFCEPSEHAQLIEEIRDRTNEALFARLDLQSLPADASDEAKNLHRGACIKACLGAAKRAANLAAMPCDEVPQWVQTALAMMVPQYIAVVWRFGSRNFTLPMDPPLLFGADLPIGEEF